MGELDRVMLRMSIAKPERSAMPETTKVALDARLVIAHAQGATKSDEMAKE